jgi:hypothetical protein
MNLPKDFEDLIAAFVSADVEHMIIGGYAVGFHGVPRTTKDLDVMIGGGANLDRVARALEAFGMSADFADGARRLKDDEVMWFGRPPLRVDLLRSAAGLKFDEAYPRAERVLVGDALSAVIGFGDLIKNKKAAGRPQDLADVQRLERARAARK